MYISFVRPLLEYCDSVWDNATTESKKQLDAIHIEAARIITGATKLCSVTLLLSDLGWESLQDRHNKHKLIIFYKIIHGLTPTYLTDVLPPLIQETTDYTLETQTTFVHSTPTQIYILTHFFLRRFGHGIACPKKQSKLHPSRLLNIV